MTHMASLLLALSISVARALPAPASASVANAVCRRHTSPFDYAAKPLQDRSAPVCPAEADSVEADSLLSRRQATGQDDYSCSATKPCGNGACCSKETGWCNYGPKACGTTGTSPNDVCWSNCHATAECGRHADPPGKECPLKVCCSPWGFCGTTDEFCKVTDKNETSCQGNCEQPPSGRSGGDVQRRVVGYYEAWVDNRTRNGMPMDRMPVGALTHLVFSFAYITPGTFDIVPMDDLEVDLFSKMTAMKKHNKALKVMVALGGWTFNDPGPTQTVFSTVASTKENRSRFIVNLLSFLRQYAFDGVDFDWEYPGAKDRGGVEKDGENFTRLLRELREAIKAQPVDYAVSFTTPSSYWYLRNFDLKASVDAADFVNVMSYDLHGIWDSWNPIGSRVLAHTNLTEMKHALDLYWRNGVPPEKLNLGIGFYGRTFELADPACHKPGCLFKGGAAPGPCTGKSGTLAYREIVDVIDQKGLKPYYDEQHQVKYIVWDQNQWASYDDAETIRAKIKFANEEGLGGLLIWSIDQDTDDLAALTAVVGPKAMAQSRNNRQAEDAASWKDVGGQDCYVTDCGGSCRPGFIKITSQPCGGVTSFGRHSDAANSQLCCPLLSAPDPARCGWRGTPPACNGQCHEGEAALQLNRWGDGFYCEDGNKVYCCEVDKAKQSRCYWTGQGSPCRGDEVLLTFGTSFAKEFADVARLFGLVGQALADALDAADANMIQHYCCPRKEASRWKNCEWKGQPGSCFDNHCDVNRQVQLAAHHFGLGLSCDPKLERNRVFCCDPPDGEPLFLPVPLADLFEHPPEGDHVDTEFGLRVDNTWGHGRPESGTDDDPNAAAFEFYVLAGPDEVHASLDRRDGSHWALFNCHDAVSEAEHVVQMVCTDDSEHSNCGAILAGAGYAVAKRLSPAANQTLPGHLARRGLGVVYDLAFDYDFSRVPRGFGDTQLRVDYSNQEGYWDRIVARPPDGRGRRARRSLADVGGSPRRWLEEEWRDDAHRRPLSRAELHRRWFGSDAVDWLRGLLAGGIKLDKRHDLDETLSAVILREQWECETKHARYEARLDAVATAAIRVSTSFGFTLVATLGRPLDLRRSFLHFDNKGSIEAVFTLEALARAEWDSGVFNLAALPLPGGAFRIPGILTVGPQLRLDARFAAGLAAEGRVEARVAVADWEVRQTYPQAAAADDLGPKALSRPGRALDTRGLRPPEFDAAVEASGYAEAHLIPTLSFGLDFDASWQMGRCAVELVANGWVRMRARSDLGCGFGFGVDAGADLRVQGVVPDALDWHVAPLTLASLAKTVVPDNGDEYRCLAGGDPGPGTGAAMSPAHPLLRKRLVPYGPLIKLPKSRRGCPNKGAVEPPGQCLGILDAEADAGPADPLPLHRWEARAGQKKALRLCDNKFLMAEFPRYPGGQVIYDNQNWADCNDYNFGVQPGQQAVPSGRGNSIERYVDEHVLEANMIKVFVDKLSKTTGSLCRNMRVYGWQRPYRFAGVTNHASEMVRIIEVVNIIKENAFKGNNVRDPRKMWPAVALEERVDQAIRSMKNVLMTYKYVSTDAIKTILVAQARRVGQRLQEAEDVVAKDNAGYTRYDLKAQWEAFIEAQAEMAMSKMEEFLTEWLPRIQHVLAGTDPNRDHQHPGRRERREKIGNLTMAVAATVYTWTNPF